MEIEQLWKKYNISFILVLPIFENILADYNKGHRNKLNIYSVFYHGGLLNTFLLKSDLTYDNTLRLVFKKDKILKLNENVELSVPVGNLLDILINSNYYKYLETIDEFVIIDLHIDSKWDNDIDNIINSKYSEVSKEYLELLKYKGVYILTPDNILNTLYIKNIPAKIVLKNGDLEKDIHKVYSTTIELDELFPKFSPTKDSFTIDNITKLIN